MDQILKFTHELKDTICSRCFCEDQKFLHHLWNGENGHKMCTSCVLFSYKFYFCPTCFDLHDRISGANLTRCDKCHSYSHSICFPSTKSHSKEPPMCATCLNPNRLIFGLKDLKAKGNNGYYKGIDTSASKLLLTAAKIVKKKIFNASDESDYFAVVKLTEAVWEKKNAISALKHCLNFEESEEDNSPETLREAARLQSLSIEGQSRRVLLEIDLNKEYSSNDDDAGF